VSRKEKVMSFKPVTTAQIAQVGKMAREKRVSRTRFQEVLDDGTLGNVLNGIRMGRSISVSELVAPPQGHVITVPGISVPHGWSWEEAVRTSAPRTDPNADEIWDLERLRWYKPESDRSERELVLVNYPDEDWKAAFVWADIFGLHHVSPYVLFALIAQKPNLLEILGIEAGAVIETYCSWYDDERYACMVSLPDGVADVFPISEYCQGIEWFVFSRPQQS